MRFASCLTLTLAFALLAPSGHTKEDDDAKKTSVDPRALLKAAQASLKDGQSSDAIRDAKAAMKELPSLYEGHLVIGKALAASGRQDEAVLAFRRGALAMRLDVPLSDEDTDTWNEMQRLLFAISKVDSTLNELAIKQASKLASMSTKLAKKDVPAAERAALSALALVPTHEKALAALKAARSGLVGKVLELLEPAMVGWKWNTRKNWPHDGDILVGKVPDYAMSIGTNRKFPIEYDVLMEARLVKDFPKKGPRQFALIAPSMSEDEGLVYGVLGGHLDLAQYVGNEKDKTIESKMLRNMDPEMDPREWNTYELRVRRREFVAIINGKEIARMPRSPVLAGKGCIGLKVQHCVVEFRRVAVTLK